ncbi:MAG: FkbM family methyltransferase [Chloroflexota bacterium]|nr:FkbM family methyltransferase [Chloroflexota bacterium]
MLQKGLHVAKRLAKVAVGRDLFYPVQANCLKEYHGTKYGGWCVCPTDLTKESIVYSFGLGNDISFDLSLIKSYGVTVYGFDPTPQSIAWIKQQETPEQFRLQEYGVSDVDGIVKFFPPANPTHISHTVLPQNRGESSPVELEVRRLPTILKELGHLTIDILKMDIEGAEYAVIDDIVTSRLEVKQILVEFHHRFREIHPKQTQRALESLNDIGFQVFNVSHSGEEYSLIRV